MRGKEKEITKRRRGIREEKRGRERRETETKRRNGTIRKGKRGRR